MTSHTSAARIFDEARRAVSVEDLATRAGIKLVRAGRERRGPCPICGAGSKSGSLPFAVREGGLSFRTFCGCNLRGDVVDLEQALGGGTLVEAARRLVGNEFRSAPRPQPTSAPAQTGPSNSDRIAMELWQGAIPIEGTLVERYLAARGIAPQIIARAAPNLRFHALAKWGWDDSARSWITAPAMLVQVQTPAGPTGGVHATYLNRSGLGKADLKPAKRMWGRQADADGRPGGAWLIGPAGAGDLVTGEGIESVLSAATLALRGGRFMRACAALSLDRLQGGLLRDDEGCIDVGAPQPNPESPAFSWPQPPGWPWREVLVAVDRDMSPIKLKGRTGRGKVCWFEFGPAERAQLCGRLAVAAWRAAGAPKVRAIAPPPGFDFNDELRRVLAREKDA